MDLKIDLETEVEKAIETRNIQALFRLARIVKKEGSDEYAEVLMDIAKKYDREDWQLDEYVDNNL